MNVRHCLGRLTATLLDDKMTTSVDLEKFTLSLEVDEDLSGEESLFISNMFGDGFAMRLEKVAQELSLFLLDNKRNGFIGHYSLSPIFSFNVTLCGDLKMKELNSEYRQKNKTTDVLSLALYEDIRSGDEMLFEEVELGDIFISVPVMEKQASEFKVTVEQELFHLMVHGFLHLLGFDHEISEEEEKLMQGLEKQLIDKIYQEIY